MIIIRRANGTGTICKLYGNRRRPWAVKLPNGFTEKGIVKYKYLSYHRTKREAEKALAAYNNDPYTLSKLTLEDLYKEYYAEQEKTKAENTMSNHRNARKHLEPLMELKVQELDRATIQAFYMSLDSTPSIVNNIRRTLTGIISLAVKKGIMPPSMKMVHKTIDLTAKRQNEAHTHTVIPKETRKWLWDNRNDDMVRLILVYILTGCRYIELYNLQPENCHDDYIEIIQAKTAAGVRVVPLCDKVKELLPVMAVPKYTTFLKRFKEVLPDHMPHDTRHTTISMLTEKEVDLRIIQSIVGHSRGRSVTERYTHISLETKLKAVNKMEL